MKRLTQLLGASGVFALLWVPLSGANADAYIDAGTGSMIIQVVIGSLFGVLLALKIFWGRIRTFLKNLFSRGKKDEEPGQ